MDLSRQFSATPHPTPFELQRVGPEVGVMAALSPPSWLGRGKLKMYRYTWGGRGRWSWSRLIAGTAALGAVSLMAGYQLWWKPVPSEGPQVTLVQTAGTTDEVDIAWPAEVTDLFTDAAEANGNLVWLKIDGDGGAQVVERDLTPRTRNGDEVKPAQARSSRISEDQAGLVGEMNAFDSSGGRDVFGALQAVPVDGSGPIVVVSSMLSTQNPLRVADLGFDAPAAEVVDYLNRLGELPQGLQDREVWLIFTPVAGEQQVLRQPQKDYLVDVYQQIIEASGGRLARVLDGAEASAGTAGSAPLTAIPPAPDTFVPTRESVPPSGSPTGVSTVRCVLPTPVLFFPDDDVLLDDQAAKAAVNSCLGEDHSTIVAVDLIGHTALASSAANDPEAMRLSGSRAERVAEIIEGLGVASDLINVEGVGATRPLFDPPTDPRNRAVEVLVSYQG